MFLWKMALLIFTLSLSISWPASAQDCSQIKDVPSPYSSEHSQGAAQLCLEVQSALANECSELNEPESRMRCQVLGAMLFRIPDLQMTLEKWEKSEPVLHNALLALELWRRGDCELDLHGIQAHYGLMPNLGCQAISVGLGLGTCESFLKDAQIEEYALCLAVSGHFRLKGRAVLDQFKQAPGGEVLELGHDCAQAIGPLLGTFTPFSHYDPLKLNQKLKQENPHLQRIESESPRDLYLTAPADLLNMGALVEARKLWAPFTASKSSFTNPADWNPQQFQFLVHGVLGDGKYKELLQKPELLRKLLLSTSVINQEKMETYGECGLILRAPEMNYYATSGSDIGTINDLIERGPRPLQDGLTSLNKIWGIQSVQNVLSETDTYNEIVVLGSNFSGGHKSEVRIDGVFIKMGHSPIRPLCNKEHIVQDLVKYALLNKRSIIFLFPPIKRSEREDYKEQLMSAIYRKMRVKFPELKFSGISQNPIFQEVFRNEVRKLAELLNGERELTNSLNATITKKMQKNPPQDLNDLRRIWEEVQSEGANPETAVGRLRSKIQDTLRESAFLNSFFGKRFSSLL